MLAAHHDQENRVHSHQMTTGKPGSRSVAPKTPGARYPKTPMKVPLNDENAGPVTGGKALLGGGQNTFGKRQALATPMGTRPRAPLGNKTTNAKAKAPPPAGAVKDKVREIEGQPKPNTTQKPKPKPVATAPLKVEVRSDEQELSEPEIEYVPPKPKDLPYESDIFPDGVLTFEGLKPENLLRGYYERYHDPVDENGVRLKDKIFEEKLQKALKEGDERILKAIEDTDWSIADVPETKSVDVPPKKKHSGSTLKPSAPRTAPTSRLAGKYPPTIASRRAATALSMTSSVRDKKPKAAATQVLQPRKPSVFLPGKRATKPIQPTKSRPESVAAEATSRSTLGYSKGRSASSAIRTTRTTGRTLSRSTSGLTVSSDHSDVTITPANFRKTQDANLSKKDDLPRPQFVSIFDANDESDEEGYSGGGAELQFDDDEDFELKLDDD